MFQTLKEPKFSHLKRKQDSLVVWWLGLHASTKGHTDLIPDWGTEILQSAWSKKEDIWILILQKLTQICVHFMSLYQHPWACSKEPAYQCRRCKRRGFDPWSGRSPAETHGNPLQCSCLENPMDRGTWWAIVHGVEKSQIQPKRLSVSIHAYTHTSAPIPSSCMNIVLLGLQRGMKVSRKSYNLTTQFSTFFLLPGACP